MTLIKFINTTVLVIALTLAFSSSAEEGDRNILESSYIFYLYYDNGQLFADRDFEFTYDVIPESFVPETVNTQFPYKGEIITLNDQIAGTFVFDPRRGNPSFLKGKISVKAPYAPDGEKAVFYNLQGQSLLTIFVSESSFCNDDGVCNPDTGEDYKTCSADCKQALPVPVASPDISADGGNGGVVKSIIYLIIGLVVARGFWWWRKRKSGQATELISNLPLPPNPNNPA